MKIIAEYAKDPAATLDYPLDWTPWLPSGDTIGTADWTVPAGLTLGSASYTDYVSTAWISGGTAGQSYVVTNQITSNEGRIDERSILIRVRDR